MKRPIIFLYLFILLKFVLQYLAIDSGYDLHRDEYLHIDLGNHLAWGYTSVPPLTGWISFIIIALGKSVFWVKFFPALFGALTMVVTWKIIEELQGGLFAWILGMVGVLFSVFIRINTLYQPNSLDFLFWTIMFFTILKYIKSEDPKWLYITAVTFAFGFLNKYNIAFLLLGLLPALLITNQRKIFLNRHFYFSILLALLLISPNLFWQYQNNFPVYHHLKTLAETQLINFDRLGFLKDQLLFFTGSIAVLIAAFISFFSYKPFKKYIVFLWVYLFTIAIFIYFQAKGYYSIGLYPVLLAFGAVYLEYLLKSGWKKYLGVALIIMPILVIYGSYRFLLPVLSPEEIEQNADAFKELGLTRWEDGKTYLLPQDFADMIGWQELAAIVDSAFLDISAKEQTLIHCDNYGQAGAINFYSKQKNAEAFSLNADYIYWYPLEKMIIQNIILVKEGHGNDKEQQREKALFDKVTLVGEIKNPYAREKGTRVYLLSGARQNINKVLAAEIQARTELH